MFKFSEHILTPVDLYRIILSLLKKTTAKDIIKIIVLFGLFIFFKYHLHWQTDSGLFMIFWIALFLWKIDSRVSIAGALLCLVSCPIFLILFNQDILILGEEYAEQAAVWAYYFLVIGVVKQIWEFRKEITKKAKKIKTLDEIIQEVESKIEKNRAYAKKTINYAKAKTIDEIIKEFQQKTNKQNRKKARQEKTTDIIPPRR